MIASAALLPFAIPGVAFAQEAAPGAQAYIGAQAGLHNLGIDEDDVDTGDFEIDDSAVIYGLYGGVDFNLGAAAVIGVEGNINRGNGPIDTEYGVAGRIGIRSGGGTIVFARAGYQWVNIGRMASAGSRQRSSPVSPAFVVAPLPSNEPSRRMSRPTIRSTAEIVNFASRLFAICPG